MVAPCALWAPWGKGEAPVASGVSPPPYACAPALEAAWVPCPSDVGAALAVLAAVFADDEPRPGSARAAMSAAAPRTIAPAAARERVRDALRWRAARRSAMSRMLIVPVGPAGTVASTASPAPSAAPSA